MLAVDEMLCRRRTSSEDTVRLQDSGVLVDHAVEGGDAEYSHDWHVHPCIVGVGVRFDVGDSTVLLRILIEHLEHDD